jgi:SAM-dependent methyltransferase
MRFTEPLFVSWLLERHDVVEPILEVGAGWTPETNQEPFRSRGYTRFLTQDMATYSGRPAPDFVSDVCAIPRAADTVGTILCFNVLEHCYAPWRAVPECWRLLANGGWLIGSVPGRAAIHRHSRDYWRFMPDGIAELLRDFKLEYLVVEGNPEMPANLLFAAVKDSSQGDWLEHNEVVASRPILITDTDYYTEKQWKRWVVRMIRRMGYDLCLWSRHEDRNRMNELGYSSWTLAPGGQFPVTAQATFGGTIDTPHEDRERYTSVPRKLGSSCLPMPSSRATTSPAR